MAWCKWDKQAAELEEEEEKEEEKEKEKEGVKRSELVQRK